MFETLDHETGTATTVLDAVRSERATADAAEARLLALACDWADLHPADSIDDSGPDPRW